MLFLAPLLPLLALASQAAAAPAAAAPEVVGRGDISRRIILPRLSTASSTVLPSSSLAEITQWALFSRCVPHSLLLAIPAVPTSRVLFARAVPDTIGTCACRAAYCGTNGVFPSTWTCGPACDAVKGVTVIATGGNDDTIPSWYVGKWSLIHPDWRALSFSKAPPVLTWTERILAYSSALKTIIVAHQGTNPDSLWVPLSQEGSLRRHGANEHSLSPVSAASRFSGTWSSSPLPSAPSSSLVSQSICNFRWSPSDMFYGPPPSTGAAAAGAKAHSGSSHLPTCFCLLRETPTNLISFHPSPRLPNHTLSYCRRHPCCCQDGLDHLWHHQESVSISGVRGCLLPS